jgi:hypothetical protein
MGRGPTVGAARRAAADWLEDRYLRDPAFRGAYFFGSAAALHGDAELPPSSDLDLAVVLEGGSAERRKLRHRGVLLEVSTFPWSAYASVDALAASYHLAASLAEDRIVADPTGGLRRIQRRVGTSFRRGPFVRRRIADAERRALELLADADAPADWHAGVTAWLFAAGVATHVILVAALANPTVRLRYLAVRRVLDAYRAGALYPRLLGALGCAHLRAVRIAEHVEALAAAFDAAAAAARTPFPFSCDVTPLARPIAIDGSRALVRSGDAREAVFWVLATFLRCRLILAADAPDEEARFAPAWGALLADLGLRGPEDLRARAAGVRALLPEVLRTADAIVTANARIVRRG